MGHGHSHAPVTAAGGQRRRLAIVLALTVGVLVAEVVGAAVSGSLALLADAGHMTTDAVGIAGALGAVTLAQRPARGRRTFGWQRVEILAAVANGLLLVAVAVFVLIEAIRRIGDPPEVESGPMLVIAGIGLVVNLVSLAVLHRGRAQSLNVRGAYLEVLADALGSVAVIVAALVILGTGWTPADTVASIVIGCLVLPRALHLLRDALDVLLEAAPRGSTWARCGSTSSGWTASSTSRPARGRSPRGRPSSRRTSSSPRRRWPPATAGACWTRSASAWASTSTSRTAPSRSRPSRTQATRRPSTMEGNAEWGEDRTVGGGGIGGPRAALGHVGARRAADLGPDVHPAPRAVVGARRRQHRRPGRLPGRRRPAPALGGALAVVADAGLGRRHGLAVRRHRHVDERLQHGAVQRAHDAAHDPVADHAAAAARWPRRSPSRYAPCRGARARPGCRGPCCSTRCTAGSAGSSRTRCSPCRCSSRASTASTSRRCSTC